MGNEKGIETQRPLLHRFPSEVVDLWLQDSREGAALFLDDIPHPGQRVALCGDYEVQTVIKAGGCGVVYTAWSRVQRRVFALKLFLPGGSQDVGAARRFQNEIWIASALHHPNIVRVLDVGDHDGRSFYSMELIVGRDGRPGRTLEDLVRNGSMTVVQAVRYAKAMAEAAQYLHDQSIIHRDMTPMNIVLDADNEIHLIDFGVAYKVNQEPYDSRSNIVGTPGYFPPEQASASGIRPGPHNDVYGIGATLYRMLAGRPPCFARELPATIQQTLEEAPIPLRDLNQDVPPFVEAVCLKCLRKDARERFCSAASLAEDLGHALESEQRCV